MSATDCSTSATGIDPPRHEMIDRWESALRERVARSANLESRELRGHMPELIDCIGQSLRGEGITTEEIEHLADRHAALRKRQDFDADALCREFELLRQAMIRAAFEDQSRTEPVSADDVLRVCEAVDRAQRCVTVAMLREKQQALADAQESFAKFLSFVSHDLRGGLNGVLLMIEVLRREISAKPDFAESADDLDMMRSSLLGTVARLERFVYAERFGRHSVPTRITSFDLRDVVAELNKRFAYDAKDRGLMFKCDVVEPCPITSDRALVTLILSNLLSNAIQASDAGEVRLIACRAHAGNGYLVVCRDSGKGIALEDLPRLLSSSDDDSDRGSMLKQKGLGMYVTREAARLLGATLTGESHLGKGTTFRVEFPLVSPLGVPCAQSAVIVDV